MAANFTIGQRKGLGISSVEPLYVLSLDKEKNEVIVGPKDKTFKKSLTVSSLNWIIPQGDKPNMQVQAKFVLPTFQQMQK